MLLLNLLMEELLLVPEVYFCFHIFLDKNGILVEEAFDKTNLSSTTTSELISLSFIFFATS